MHQLFILASRQLLHPIIQTFFGCQDFQSAEKKSAKIQCRLFSPKGQKFHTAEIIDYTVYATPKNMNLRCIIRGFKVKHQPQLQDNGCFIFTLCLSYFHYEVFQNINSSEQFQRSIIINKETMIQVQNNINICEIVELGESMRYCIPHFNPLLGLG